MTDKNLSDILLKYQKNWLLDIAQIKLGAKSRRIGFTWTQALEDVKDATTLKIRGKVCDVWFTSADLSAAKEYVIYCESWAKALNEGVKDLGEIVIDEDKDIKALSLEFQNGARINALSSNPSSFRSKGGKVVIDEFAFHKNPIALLRAAIPVITWGYPLRILSSLNGKNNLFYELIQKIKKGILNWSLHEITIFDAVNDGLLDKIYDRPTTQEEREKWLEDLKKSCADEVTWLQEYCCVAVDEAGAFISYDLINTCVSDNTLISDIKNLKGDLYLGFDVARKKDLSVISVFEKIDSIFYLRKLIEFKNTKFTEQKETIRKILELPNCRRLAIDSTGIGNQMSEELKDEFGSRKVEPISFTSKVKEELAYKLLYAFQDTHIRIPDNEELKDDIHSVKRMTTDAGGVIRFDVARTETDGHADRFWSLALAVYAGTNEPYIKPQVFSAKRNSKNHYNDTFNLRALYGF